MSREYFRYRLRSSPGLEDLTGYREAKKADICLKEGASQAIETPEFG